jgi:hypothetical protein
VLLSERSASSHSQSRPDRRHDAVVVILSGAVLTHNGSANARGAKFQASRTLAGTIAYRVEGDDRLLIFDADGILLAKYPWPAPATKYVDSGRKRGPKPKTA